jgi:hypothetical protein
MVAVLNFTRNRMNMERDEIKEKIISIFEANKSYGGAVKHVGHVLCVPPALNTYQMRFTFAETTDNHLLSLRRIIDELSKIGTLNHFEYHGLKAPTENMQRTPCLHFNVTTADGRNYEIIFELP